MGFEKGWNPFMEYNNIEVAEVSEHKSRMVAHIGADSKNPYGMIHGGLIYTMIDCCAGITARADGESYVTQNAYVNYLSNTSENADIYAESDVVRRGASIVVVHVKVFTADGKDIADATVDMFHVQ